jgi:hypothetical protein
MKDYRISMAYVCITECEPGGCPAHLASLDYQASSDTYAFDTGTPGGAMVFDRAQADVLLQLLTAAKDWP